MSVVVFHSCKLQTSHFLNSVWLLWTDILIAYSFMLRPCELTVSEFPYTCLAPLDHQFYNLFVSNLCELSVSLYVLSSCGLSLSQFHYFCSVFINWYSHRSFLHLRLSWTASLSFLVCIWLLWTVSVRVSLFIFIHCEMTVSEFIYACLEFSNVSLSSFFVCFQLHVVCQSDSFLFMCFSCELWCHSFLNEVQPLWTLSLTVSVHVWLL